MAGVNKDVGAAFLRPLDGDVARQIQDFCRQRPALGRGKSRVVELQNSIEVDV